MYVLALDSTASVASVALTDDERLLGETTVDNGNTHSETLLPMIEELLRRFSLSPSDVELYACTAGPGSFTGVRIGVSTVKGLAFATRTPCVGVSTLASLAQNLVGLGDSTPVIVSPVMNARRSQVYNALFRVNGNEVTRLTEDRAIAIADLEQELLSYNEPIYLCGDGYDITMRGFTALTPRETPIRLRAQSGYSTAIVGLYEHRLGHSTSDRALVPVYLRPCQAERERLERESAGQA